MSGIGPNFGREVIAAGLGGLPFAWGADGNITGRQNLTSQQNATLDTVIAAHDPTKTTVPQIISDRQFFQALAMSQTITDDEALAAVKTGALPAALQNALATMPADQKFNAEMMLSGATAFERDHPMTDAMMGTMGWDAKTTDDLWRYAATL